MCRIARRSRAAISRNAEITDIGPLNRVSPLRLLPYRHNPAPLRNKRVRAISTNRSTRRGSPSTRASSIAERPGLPAAALGVEGVP